VAAQGVQVRGRRLPLPRARSDAAAEDLAALAGAWGGTYDIGFAGNAWHASCLRGVPLLLTAKTPGELAALIQADWVRRGVR